MTLRDAQQIAHGLIQGYIGPDHKVMDMKSFFGALVQALQTAHQQKIKKLMRHLGANSRFVAVATRRK